MSNQYAPKKIPCSNPSCKNYSLPGNSGFCEGHDPALAERRRQSALKAVATRKLSQTPPKNCSKENCRHHFGIDSSGYCYAHSPLKAESRLQSSIALNLKRKNAPPEAKCRQPGCNSFPIQDGSGYCFCHHPGLRKEQLQAIKTRVQKARSREVPADKACKFKDCKKRAREDGSQLCFFHQPAYRLQQRNLMLGNKYTLGKHFHWLGLKDIHEARGLIFYSLQTDQPLLTLRALTKIVSLHARGEVYIPGKPNLNVEPVTLDVEPGDNPKGNVEC